VAIARSMVNNPYYILADEPTGNLDSVTSNEILDLFDKLHEQGRTIILVTHEDSVSERTSRIIRLMAGEIEFDERSKPLRIGPESSSGEPLSMDFDNDIVTGAESTGDMGTDE
jgi:putative ABC transport system ATP-binding protein